MIKNGLKCSKTTILADNGAQVRRGGGVSRAASTDFSMGGPKGGGTRVRWGGLARDSRHS